MYCCHVLAVCQRLLSSFEHFLLHLWIFPKLMSSLLGAVIIFTALLSVAFLGSTIRKVMWTGIFIILVGLALVGVSDIIFGNTGAQTDTNGIIAGKLIGHFLIIFKYRYMHLQGLLLLSVCPSCKCTAVVKMSADFCIGCLHTYTLTCRC